MRILKLEMENWGSYGGSGHTIEFAKEPGSQITFILAKNGRGKTTILQALNFVLYGQPNSPITRASEQVPVLDFPNRPALAAGNPIQVSVKLTFEYENFEWELLRKFTAVSKAGITSIGEISKSLIRVGSGPGISTESIDDFVSDNLLNRQVSHFYFFNGVMLAEIQAQLTRKDENARHLVMESVENALGLRFLDHLGQNLKACLEHFDRTLAKQEEANVKNAKTMGTIAQLTDTLKRLEADRSILIEKRDEFELRRDDFDRQLESIGEETREKVVRRKVLAESSEALQGELTRAVQKIKDKADGAWLGPLRAHLESEFAALSAQSSENDKLIRARRDLEIKVDGLRSTIKSGKCSLCGHTHDLSDNPKIEQEISDLLTEHSLLPEPITSLGEKLVKITRALNTARLNESVADSIQALDEIKIKIAGNKRESQRISDDLGTFGSSIDVSWLETQRNDAQIQFEKYSVAVSANEADRAENERQLNAAKTKLVGESDISSRDKALRNTTDLLLRSVNKSFGGFREEMRKQIQDKATESLKILTSEPHIYGSVQISSDYHIQILTPQGVALKTSNAGHQQILTTAFVSAMAAVSTESTPFMMDTALSHLDTDNSRQMLEWTKQIGQQVVLLVQPKELSREDAHRILGSSIGREYEIDRNNDQAEESHIMEVVK